MARSAASTCGSRRAPPPVSHRAAAVAWGLLAVATSVASVVANEAPSLVRVAGSGTVPVAAPAATRLVPIGAAPALSPAATHDPAAPPLVRIGASPAAAAGPAPAAVAMLPVSAAPAALPTIPPVAPLRVRSLPLSPVTASPITAAPIRSLPVESRRPATPPLAAVPSAPTTIRSLPIEPATPGVVRALPVPPPIPSSPPPPPTIARLPVPGPTPVPNMVRPQPPVAAVSVAPPELPRPAALPPLATAQPQVSTAQPQVSTAQPQVGAAQPHATPAPPVHAAPPPLSTAQQPFGTPQPQRPPVAAPVALPPLPALPGPAAVPAPLAAAQPQSPPLPQSQPAPIAPQPHPPLVPPLPAPQSAAVPAAPAAPAADALASRSVAAVPAQPVPPVQPAPPQPAAPPPVAPAAPAGPGKPADAIVVGSFNIQVFGESKISKKNVVDVLARVVRGFDVVAIQEVRAKSDDVIPQFVAAINADGSRYQHVIGPRLGRTVSKEQYCFIYDTNRIEIDPTSVGTLPDPDGRLHRPPLHARFRVKANPPESGFTFWLVDTHTDPDEVKQEVDALADVFVAMRSLRPDEDDVILLGDFNASPAQFGRIRSIPGIGWAVSNATTNTRRNKTYDNLVFVPASTAEYTGRWGVLDLQDTFGLPLDKALEVSDHNPVWAAFRPWEAPRVPVAAQPVAAGATPPR